jgi:hypothetical protein
MRTQLNCSEFKDLAVLHAVGELDDAARAAVEAHARECPACALVLRSEAELQRVAAARGETAESLDASGLLLARCRSELAEALDDLEGTPQTGWRERFSPARWAAEFRRALAFHPGWSTAALLVVGALGGVVGRAWYRETSLPLPGKPVMTVSAAPRMSDQELETMGVDAIGWTPQTGGAAPRVEVRLHSDRPLVVQGASDDAEIRRLLTYVVRHGQKFDPGLRLDSLDVLRTRVSDPQVRSALCEAAVHDSNPAVRLKALDALHDLGADSAVRRAMFAALADDDNSGVRIEALNALFAAFAAPDASAMSPDPQALGILRDRMQNDPNNYVRMRSANVLSQLTSLDDDSAPPPAGSPRR